jgi:nucleoside-diphosphate-sugar epimerase
MKVLLIGGTGVISRCIVEQLLEKHCEVTIFHRGKNKLKFNREVQEIIGDRNDSSDFQTKLKELKVDFVIDMISFTHHDAQLTIETFKNRVQQIIITSSVAVYKRPLNTVPTFEDKEELTEDPSFQYAFQKAEMERYLQKVIAAENLPITILRPSLTFGAGAANLGVLRQNYGIVDRIKKGKPLIMFGDGTNPFSFTFAPDLAKAYLGVLGNKETYGKSYHVANPEQHIWDDLYLEFGKVLGIEPKILHLPSELLNRLSPETFSHIHYEKKFAGLYDITKIQNDIQELNFDISLRKGIEMMIKDYEEKGSVVDPIKDQFEDKLVRLYEVWDKEFRLLSARIN